MWKQLHDLLDTRPLHFCDEIKLFYQHDHVHPLNEMPLFRISVSVEDYHLTSKQPSLYSVCCRLFTY